MKNVSDTSPVDFSIEDDGDIVFYPKKSVMKKWGFDTSVRPVRFRYEPDYFGDPKTRETGIRFWEVDWERNRGKSGTCELQKQGTRTTNRLQCQRLVKAQKVSITQTRMCLLEDDRSIIIQLPKGVRKRDNHLKTPDFLREDYEPSGNHPNAQERMLETYEMLREEGLNKEAAKRVVSKLMSGEE